jgi:hypothetical protein
MNTYIITNVTIDTLQKAAKDINNSYRSLAVTVGTYTSGQGKGCTLLFINGVEVMEAWCPTQYEAMLNRMYTICDIIMAIPAVQRNKRK